MVRVALILMPLLALGCQSDGQPAKPGAQDAAARYVLSPAVAGRGTSLSVRLDASSSDFVFGDTALDLGPDIVVSGLTVQDGFTAVAEVQIAEDAELGPRDALLSFDGREAQISGAFEVIAESFEVDPPSAKMGELVDVTLLGTDTEWADGTWASFGDGIEVLEFSVLSPSLAMARIAVRPDARPGWRDVTVEQQTHVVTHYSGFTVDRAAVIATFDPPQAMQGATVAFTLHGLGTNFYSNATSLEFWDDGGWNQDIVITQLTVIDAENAFGRMRLSNAAAIGLRDVLVRGADDILVPEALEVLDAPPDLDNVAVGLGFDISRQIDNSSGALQERVSAIAYFVIPLDPPCGAAPPPGSGPSPYDINGVFAVPPPADPVDCPNAETVSAGDFVWFESDENVVTLYKDVIASTGQIIYVGRDLTLDDYRFGQVYDLHTQGDPDGIPEVLVEAVQPTVPADYYLLTPSLWGDYTHDRSQRFDYSWTPAQTYPSAIFSTQISGTLASNGDPGFAGALPWDDGAHSYTAGELLLLNPGPVSFSATSYIQGRYFGLPFSSIQTNQSDSTLTTSASLSLE